MTHPLATAHLAAQHTYEAQAVRAHLTATLAARPASPDWLASFTRLATALGDERAAAGLPRLPGNGGWSAPAGSFSSDRKAA